MGEDSARLAEQLRAAQEELERERKEKEDLRTALFEAQKECAVLSAKLAGEQEQLQAMREAMRAAAEAQRGSGAGHSDAELAFLQQQLQNAQDAHRDCGAEAAEAARRAKVWVDA